VGCFCVEGKTEGYKSTLKRWNEEQFGNVRKNQKCIFQELNELELKEDVQFLNAKESLKKKKLQEEFWRVPRRNESLLRQKSRVKWLNEGGKNSKFFHTVVNWSGKKNMLNGLFVEDLSLDEPWRVKEEVFNLYKVRF